MGDIPAVDVPATIGADLLDGTGFEVVGARCVAMDPMINGPMVTVFGRIDGHPMDIQVWEARDPIDPLFNEGPNVRVWSWQVNAAATFPDGISVSDRGARLDNVAVEGTSKLGMANISLGVAC